MIKSTAYIIMVQAVLFFCLFMRKSKKYAKIEKTFKNFATKGDKTVLI